MAKNFEIWSPRLAEASRRALELITMAWHAGQSTDNDHAMFQLVRAGWSPDQAQKWLYEAQSKQPPLLSRGERNALTPTLAAVLAISSNPTVAQDLLDLERVVAYLHENYDPDRPQPSAAAMSTALDFSPDRLRRIAHLAGIYVNDDVVYSATEPLYWTSFDSFLQRKLPLDAPRVETVPPLPIDALVEQIQFQGIGPFRGPTTLRLSPMTVLVGPNGAGKTTTLVALWLLRNLARDGFKATESIAERIGTGVSEFMVAVTAELIRPGAASSESITWQLVVGLTAPRPALSETLRRVRPLPLDPAAAELTTFHWGTGRWRDDRGQLVEHTMLPGELALTTATSPAAHSQLLAIRQSLQRWRIKTVLPRWRRPTDPPLSAKLTLSPAFQDGSDAFDTLCQHARAVTGIKDLTRGEHGELLIQDASGEWLDAHLMSTGVVRAIDILATVFAPEPPPLIALDEIENNLHGNLAARLIDVMRSVSHRTRIVVTTHSARVLRCFQASELRLVRRNGTGSTIVGIEDDPQLRRLTEADDLGDLIEDGYFAGGM